jgi:hypothetical protein
MRAADGGEQQRVLLRRDDVVKAWVSGHFLTFVCAFSLPLSLLQV